VAGRKQQRDNGMAETPGKDIALLQSAYHWLDKAIEFASQGRNAHAERAFAMALRKEAEYFGQSA